MIREINYPFTLKMVRNLRVGDRVTVSGRIFTGRDRLHKYLFDGGPSPVDLRFAAIYHCGPVMVRKKGRWVVRAAGPTTSIREELYMPDIIRKQKLTVIIGKGGMGDQTRKALIVRGGVYLHAVGGAAQVLADKVEQVVGVHFLQEFGRADAMWELIFQHFPAIVTMDSQGNSLHEQVAMSSNKNLRKVW